MGRIMGLDYGSKTVGVALTDETKTIASPEETILREREGLLRPTLRRILELCRQKQVERIVVGDPMHMDGSRGQRSALSQDFARVLSERLAREQMDVPVVMQDERLTTVAADEILEEVGIKSSQRKQYIDKIAASLILEEYLKQNQPKC